MNSRNFLTTSSKVRRIILIQEFLNSDRQAFSTALSRSPCLGKSFTPIVLHDQVLSLAFWSFTFSLRRHALTPTLKLASLGSHTGFPYVAFWLPDLAKVDVCRRSRGCLEWSNCPWAPSTLFEGIHPGLHLLRLVWLNQLRSQHRTTSESLCSSHSSFPPAPYATVFLVIKTPRM